MEVFKRISFKQDDREYEIRVLHDSRVINVVSFRDNHPANGYRYRMMIPGQFDMDEVLRRELFDHLVEKAKDDLIENRWHTVLQIKK
jgi:hypothetical protein